MPRQPGRATAIGRRDVGAAVEVAEVLVRGAAVTRGEGVGEALGADTVDGGREAAAGVLGEAVERGLVVNGL